MDTLNYFISPEDIQNQESENAYGPTTDAQFRVTSLFEGGNNPMAFAVTDGLVFIVSQEDNDDRVNLFIKPTTWQFNVDIKYFVYRGLLKGDFLDSGNSYDGIKPTSDDDSVFIQKLRKGQNPDDALDLYDDLSDDYFVDDLFFDEDNTFGLVSQGDSIGRFDTALAYGFEIMLDETFFSPTFEIARIDDNLIDLSDSDDEEVSRFQILNYIDPAAFYGLFAHSAFSVGTNLTSPTSNTKDDVYSFINQFYTKNIVYIDLRDQYGWPIDWFDDSPKTIKLTSDGSPASSSAEINYRGADLFPIMRLTDGFANSQTSSIGQSYFILNLSLSIDNLDTPLLSLRTGYWLKFLTAIDDSMNFSICSSGEADGWSDDKSFCVFAANDSQGLVPIGSYFKLSLGEYDDIDAINNQIPYDPIDSSDDIDLDNYIDGLFPFHLDGIPEFQSNN